MRAWLAYWLLGRRHSFDASNRYGVRLFWWSKWKPIRFRKVAGPVYMTHEVRERLLNEKRS